MDLSSVLLAVAFILVLGTVVTVHELGHFLAARAVGVRIRELGIGLPPRLLKLGAWAGTNITLNWIPLGGFVKPEGEFDPQVEGGLGAASPLARLGVFWAGGVANLVLCLILLTVGFMSGWPDRVQVIYVAPGSPAEAAGLLPDDLIVAADGGEVRDAGDLSDRIADSPSEPLELTVQRGGSTLAMQLVPRNDPPEGEGPAGFTSRAAIVRYGLGRAVARAFEEMASLFDSIVRLSLDALGGGGSGETVRITGPVGLKQTSDVAIRNAVAFEQAFPVLYLGAWLSLAVALTNLLPLPALDGGRAAFVLIEIIRGRRVDPKRERLVHAAGMVVLLALLVVLTVRDVRNPLL